MFNFFLTTLQTIFAVMTEHRGVLEEFKVVSPEEYSEMHTSYFSFKLFWSWISLAVFHGILIYILCMAGFEASFDPNTGVKSIGQYE